MKLKLETVEELNVMVRSKKKIKKKRKKLKPIGPWANTVNLEKIGKGQYRSILGYAGESLAIGRALACGYNLFFKAWKDSKYDAVLDSHGCLFRIEIKQCRDGNQLSLTSGNRSGKLIRRDVKSREAILSATDCDFMIGTHSLSGKSWILPVELLEILKKKALQTSQLQWFEEKWAIIGKLAKTNYLDRGHRLYNLPAKDLNAAIRKFGFKGSLPNHLVLPNGRKAFKLKSLQIRRVVKFWELLYVVDWSIKKGKIVVR